MISINEWLPNPVGTDAAGEFIELYNNGASAADLSGWRIGTGAGTTTAEGIRKIIPAKTKPASLSGLSIPSGGYLVLTHAEDGLSLKNTDGALLLYGPDGTIVDDAAFQGAAPEGQSYSLSGKYSVFTDPTPGSVNAASAATIAVARHEAGVPLGPPPAVAPLAAAGSAVGFGALLAVIITYAIKKNRYLSHLLFGGDEAPRGGILEMAFRRAPTSGEEGK